MALKSDAKDLFVRAHQLSEKERETFLEEACGDDAELRLEVQRLLVDSERADSFFADEEGKTVSPEEFEIVSEAEGDQVGPYSLRQKIGEGGFGTVWMAEQTTPISRMVALKVLKPGMDTRQVLARFEAERQALAMMDHPNIARVLDAGATASGRPYFAMELVKGIPITQFCDDQKLDARRRLELFRDVCSAVNHAHQKGIIHRDLKPSNVMITLHGDKPTVKVIDFGIAKATHSKLTEKTLFTRFEQFLGTPVYMSPEQASMSGLDIDTRSDIYSLGVLLYELLTGSPPFDQKSLLSAGYDEMRRIIKEKEPPKPSKRLTQSQAESAATGEGRPLHVSVNALKGDLDWIVMKCLEKDRSRRYQTANGLAEDIRRHLSDEPVVAGPPSARYKLQKFVRRNRAQVILGGLVASVLVLGLLATSAGMLWAIREQAQASKAFRKASEESRAARSARTAAVVAKREADHARYRSDIPRADALLNQPEVINAREVLRSTPPEFRNFEWAWLVNRAWHESTMTQPEPRKEEGREDSASFWSSGEAGVFREFFPWQTPGGLHGGFFSPADKSVFFTHASGEIKAFAFPLKREIATFSTEDEPVIALDLSPSGKHLVVFTFSNRGAVWDVLTGQKVASSDDGLSHPSPWVARWSPDEKYVVTGHMDGAIRIWKRTSRRLVLLEETEYPHEKDVRDVWFAPQVGTEISSGTFWTASIDGTVRQWTLPEGEHVDTRRPPEDGDPAPETLGYQAISPSGKYAVTMRRNGSSLIWNIESEEIESRLSIPRSDSYSGQIGTGGVFSPDESCVALMTDNTGVTIYKVPTGEFIRTIPANGVALDKMSFSHDGRYLLTTSEHGRATIWTNSSDQPGPLTQAHEDAIFQVNQDASGDLLLTGSYDKTASVWRLPGMRHLESYKHEAEVIAVDLSPDGTRAATLDASGALHLWNVTSGQPIKQIPGSDGFSRLRDATGGGLRSNMLNFPAPLSTGIFTPDGAHFVAFQNEAMRVFNALTGDEEVKLDQSREAGWPVYSHDSSLVAVLGMNERTASVWDLNTGELKHREIEHLSPLVMMDFSPVDRRLVTGAMENNIKIWDASTGELERVLNGKAGNVMSCRFSDDGRYVLAGYADSTARIWDSNTGELVTTLANGHLQRLRDVRLSPDGTRILTWAMDDKAIVWDWDPAEPKANALLRIEGDSMLLQARWSSGGRDIVIAWSDGKVEVIRGATRKDLEQLPAAKDLTDQEIQEWRRRHTNSFRE